MYLHLGSDVSVPIKNVEGVFDLELTTITGATRDLLKKAENEGHVYSVSDDMPKSFVLVKEKDTDTDEEIDYIYLTSISVSTLRKRVVLY